MNRFTMMLAALGLAFGAGWLFGNQVRPPLLADVSVAMWIACGGVAVLASMIATVSGRGS